MNKIIEVKNISKKYKMGEITVDAVKDISFDVEEGEFVVILGPSGSGKSTVLNMIGGIDKVTSGEIIVDRNHIENYSLKELTDFRAKNIGFVFQFYNLIPMLTVKENVEAVLEVGKKKKADVNIYEKLKIEDKLNNFPSQLSGGEQQRVAIARAIVSDPRIVLCDEPTGALDYQTGIAVLETLQEINRLYHKTIIIITHNTDIAQIANKVIKVKSGLIEDIIINKNPKLAKEVTW